MNRYIPFASGTAVCGVPGTGWQWMVTVSVPSAVSSQTFSVLVNGVAQTTLTGSQVYGPIALTGLELLTVTGSTVYAGQSVLVAGEVLYVGVGEVNPPNVYNVMEYGADPTGQRDSTAAIQAALDAAGTGGTIFVPYSPSGYLCGALSIPSGVCFQFAPNAKLVAPSSLESPWIAGAPGVHQGTSVVGGTFDATAVTSNLCTAVIDFGVTSCPLLTIKHNRIINAPVHGVQVSESIYTPELKLIESNSVEGYGIAATGFGLYGDYIGSLVFSHNTITSVNGNDAIEMGHSGPAHLGINANMKAIGNVIHGAGALEFPFSDYAEIIGNTLDTGGIYNDINTANYVTITGNSVLAGTPANGYAGIRVAGSYSAVTGNNVTVTQNNGIGLVASTGSVVSGNVVGSTAPSTGRSGSAFQDDASGIQNAISGNILGFSNGPGGFIYGLSVLGTHSSFVGNTFNDGCFDGIYNGGTNNVFGPNNLQSYNVQVAGTGDSSNRFYRNTAYNPTGAQTAPTVPASGTALANPFPFDCTVAITGTCTVTVGGIEVASISGGPSPVFVGAGQTITLTYTTAPTWAWTGH